MGGGFIMPVSATRGYSLAKKVIELTSQPNRIFQIVLDNDEIKKLIRQLNTAIQLRTQHIDSEGDTLFSKKHESGVYSITTEIRSKGRKKAGTSYTLFDTGEFFKSWEIEIGAGFIIINADPIKEGRGIGQEGTNLFEEYGENIVGLTEESLRILTREALKLHIQFFKAQLGI